MGVLYLIKAFRLIIILSFSIVLAACGGGSNNDNINTDTPVIVTVGAEGGAISSADGLLSLQIPADALTETVDISVTKLNPVDFPEEFEGIDTIFAYELGPSGLTLEKPITISIPIELSILEDDDAGSAIAAILTSSNSIIELLDNVTLSIDQNTGITSLSGELSHFSTIAVVLGLYDRFKITGIPGVAQVGQKFNVNAMVTHSAESDISAERIAFYGSVDLADPLAILEEMPIDMGSLVASQASVLSGTVKLECLRPGLAKPHFSVGYEDMYSDGTFKLVKGFKLSNIVTKRQDKWIICIGPDSNSGATSIISPYGSGPATSFLLAPSKVTKTLEESFKIAITEIALDNTNEYEIWILDSNPGIVSKTELGNPATSAGAEMITLFPNKKYDAIEIQNPVIGANTQNLSYKCLKAGDTTIGFELRVFPKDEGFYMAKDLLTVHVSCKDPESIGWIDSFQLTAPETYVGYIGLNVRDNYWSAGDPFADESPIRHQSLDVLDLPADRDYALVSGADQIGVWDLHDGTEVERLSMPAGLYPYLGGVFLVAPESDRDTAEWMVFYTGSGGYSETSYNSDSGEWGMSQFHPYPNSRVTDIVPGPVDINGRDTGYLVVDNGSDSVSFLGWDSEVTDWRRPAGFIRTSGEWRQSGDVVSVVGGFDGPALVLVENGEETNGSLWLFDPREEHIDNTDQNLGSVGMYPWRLRCLRGVCVTSNFGDNTISTISWANPEVTPVIHNTADVGGSPLDIDLIPDPDGDGVLALTTGFNENNYTVTSIDADASITNSTVISLTGCDSPTNAHFTDGSGSHVMISCNGSDQVIIQQH
ncbi:MAG: hypothetical protein GY744_03655 [Gammaproteobacteria bacterium]|nr:hypothetical protein [Gammaproteobacteria bacterium]